MKVFKIIQNNIQDVIHRHADDWDDIANIPDIVDSYTYDEYESSNPLRIDFWEEKAAANAKLQKTLDIAQNVGAEVISAYTNPFYLSHKVLNLPNDYKNIVEVYKKYSDSNITN